MEFSKKCNVLANISSKLIQAQKKKKKNKTKNKCSLAWGNCSFHFLLHASDSKRVDIRKIKVA
jgi:hypothetical protein